MVTIVRPSFRQWVKGLAITDIPDNGVGDFISDARLDFELPDVKSASDLRSYLMQTGACREALAVIPAVWKRYQQATG